MQHANRWQRGELFLSLLLVFVLFNLVPQWAFATDNTQKPLEDNVAAPDVVAQFNALRTEGEWIGSFLDPRIKITGGTSTSHYQGISRAPYKEGGQNNIFYVSKSGDRCNASGNDCGNYFGTVTIDSAATRANAPSRFGERIGSNLLLKGVETGGTVPIIDGNRLAVHDGLVDVQSSRDWKHPGGTQNVGDVMAVPYEQPFRSISNLRSDGVYVDSRSKILFYDTRNPESPQLMTYSLDMSEADIKYDLDRLEELSGKDRFEAGVAAMTRLPNGKFMLMVTFALDAVVAVFVSSHDSFFILDEVTGEYVENSNFYFDFYDVWEAREAGCCWPHARSQFDTDKLLSAFQQLTLINQMDGKLFLMGSFNSSKLAPVINGDDLLVLFEVNGFPGDTQHPEGEIVVSHRSTRHLRMTTHDEVGQGATHGNGNAGVSAYVSPTRELLVYTIAHFENDEDIIRIGEYRHANMVYGGNNVGVRFRPGQLSEPTTIGLGQTYVVDASAHINSSWVDFYEDDNFNKGDPGPTIQMMEAPRQFEDDFQNFSKLDGAGIDNGFNDKMTSFIAGLEDDHLLYFYDDRDYEQLMFAITPPAGPDEWGAAMRNDRVQGAANDKLSSSRFFTLYDLLPTESPNETQFNVLQAQLVSLTGQPISLGELRHRHAASRPSAQNWEWDIGDDGVFEIRTSGPRLNFTPEQAGEYAIAVRYKGITQDVDGNRLVKYITVEESPVVVPNILGMEEKNVDRLLRDLGLQPSRTGSEYDDVVPAFHVLSQDVSADSVVGLGSTIGYVISKGQDPNTVMPDLIGKTLAEAEQLIIAAGLTLEDVFYERHPTAPKGLVFDANADANEVIPRDFGVKLRISEGTGDEVIVPDVIGLQLDTAEDTLIAASLTRGDVEYVHHPVVANGAVLEQLPFAGVEVQPGEAIDLIVSLGPIPVITGDIDEDGDVDGIDLNLLMVALNQPADSPSDKRDIDGDGVITALDARKLVLLFCSKDTCLAN